MLDMHEPPFDKDVKHFWIGLENENKYPQRWTASCWKGWRWSSLEHIRLHNSHFIGHIRLPQICSSWGISLLDILSGPDQPEAKIREEPRCSANSLTAKDGWCFAFGSSNFWQLARLIEYWALPRKPDTAIRTIPQAWIREEQRCSFPSCPTTYSRWDGFSLNMEVRTFVHSPRQPSFSLRMHGSPQRCSSTMQLWREYNISRSLIQWDVHVLSAVTSPA